MAFGTSQLMQLFSGYRINNLEVNLVIDLNDQLINLNEENINIALRITETTQVNLVMHEISEICWIYYGSQEYLTKRAIPRTMGELVR